jgi:iron(III) transport system substrate-binding protein
MSFGNESCVSMRRLRTSSFNLILCGMVLLLIPAANAAPGVSGTLAVYTSISLDVASGVIEGFTRRHPDLKVEVLRAGSVEIERRLLAEIETGGIKADVLWLGEALVLFTLRQQGHLQPYRSREARYLPAAWRDPSGILTATRLANMVIAVNPTLIPVRAAPRRWADLPRFGRTAAMPSPAFSGTAQLAVAALVREYGWGWFERARAEGMTVLRGNSDVTRSLTSREVGVGMALDYLVHRLIREGAPLAIVWPDDGVISVPGMAAIVARTRNPQAAQAFIDYLASKVGQQAMVAEGMIPMRADVDPPAGLPRPADLMVLPVPYDWAVKNARELRARFDEIMMR